MEMGTIIAVFLAVFFTKQHAKQREPGVNYSDASDHRVNTLASLSVSPPSWAIPASDFGPLYKYLVVLHKGLVLTDVCNLRS